ncbi:MAG: hypothetical protein IT301_03000 [Dehalococcoidia bacterium]|nr:hypothetical protein [Dehalococcoidia bacterium]
MLTRRTFFRGLAAAGLVFTPVALGWKSLLSGGAAVTAVSQANDDRPTNVLGTSAVKAVANDRTFTAVTPRGAVVQVQVPADVELSWPAGHVAEPGDRVDAYGYWTGALDASVFVAKKLWFNIERIRGTVVREPNGALTLNVGSQGWALIVAQEWIEFVEVDGSEVPPEQRAQRVAALEQDSWADVIGFTSGGPRSLTVTRLSAWAPQP